MAGSNPPLRQILPGSGVPGKGVLVQSANPQSLLRIGIIWLVSEARLVSVALAVSRLTGRGRGVPPAIIAIVLVFGAISTKRASTGPVILEPSGFLATGTAMVWTPSRDARSPCHPLVRITWPRFR